MPDKNQLLSSISGGSIMIYDGVECPVKKAFANVAASQTDSSLVTAVSGKSIVVIAVHAHAGATATNLTFNSKGAGAGTAITPAWPIGANGGYIETENRFGWFATNVGEALTATTGAGSTTAILITYIEV